MNFNLKSHLPYPKRIVLALLIGLLSGVLAYTNFTLRRELAADFTIAWRAARFLLAKQDPYTKINPAGSYPWHDHFLYPLTTAIIAIPFTSLPPIPAGSLFFGFSATFLAYGVLKEGYKRLPLFLSAPFWVAAAVGQWSPMITAAVFFKASQFLFLAKPNLGLAAFAYHPTKRSILMILMFFIVSILIFPSWPARWLSDIRDAPRLVTYKIPALVLFPLGLFLLAAIRHWRKPEGRLLISLSLVPQTLWFYDQLLLWLIPRDFKETWLLTISSWFAYGIWRAAQFVLDPTYLFANPDVYILIFCYLPALCLLFQPDLKWLQSLWEKLQSVRFIHPA